ncbi:glycoside hydrolase family 108 protein [Loktanella sp. R86503]|uniref:glycoside hydrolase family 108 protein n=1 Tax=Loktanella sp. R86503 TaxID=3093847 RepID=UPI0036DCE7E2
MTRAELCIPRTLAHEGGYVNHPNDPGGATNKGITIGTYRAYIDPKGSVADLKALTEAQAVKVYKAEYWDKVKGDDLPAGVDYAVFDFAVNSGPSRAATYLQEIVGAAPDGKIGPMTIAAVKAMDAAWIVNQLCNDRMAFLRRLSTFATFGKGWTRRVSDVRAAALLDATAPLTAPTAPPVASDDDKAAEARLIALVDAMRLLIDQHDPRV